MNERKIDAMHKLFGEGPALCKDCDHFISGTYHDKRLHKCALYGITHSDATDWRLSYKACGMFNRSPDDNWIPVLKRLKQATETIDQLPGQLNFLEAKKDPVKMCINCQMLVDKHWNRCRATGQWIGYCETYRNRDDCESWREKDD